MIVQSLVHGSLKVQGWSDMMWWVVSTEGWGLVSLGQVAPFRSPDVWTSFGVFSLLTIWQRRLKSQSLLYRPSLCPLGLAAV